MTGKDGENAPVRLPETAAPETRRRERRTLTLALAAMLLVTAVFGWQWYDTREQMRDLEEELGRRLADAESYDKTTRLLAQQAQEAAREMQVKQGLLEGRLAESQNQQVALEALYQELSRSRDEGTLAGIEQILAIANEELQLAGNVKAALIALQNVDNRLLRMDKPQFAPLRKILNRDMERLKAVPDVDTVGISMRLDNLTVAADALPLAQDERPQPEAAAFNPVREDGAAWRRLAREAWAGLQQMVRIQNIQKPEPPLLSPGQVYFLRENLKLRLLSARFAVLARDQTTFKADVKAAESWLNRYFDMRAKPVLNALSSLRELDDTQVSVEVPDISASLDAVHNFKLSSRERVPR